MEKLGSHKPEDDGAKPPVQVVTQSQWPKLPNFSGSQPGKNEVAYDEWQYEVKCLMSQKIHTDGAILQSTRRSLHGEPGRVVMRLGPLASVQDILHKLDGIYGIVERGETLLGDFYSATQGDEEDVVAWSCRLEDLLDKAKGKGLVNDSGADEMLRTKFWLGLRPSLRDASSHKFDSCKQYDDLRVALRIIEHDRKQHGHASSKKQAQIKSQIKADPSTDSQERPKEDSLSEL